MKLAGENRKLQMNLLTERDRETERDEVKYLARVLLSLMFAVFRGGGCLSVMIISKDCMESLHRKHSQDIPAS